MKVNGTDIFIGAYTECRKNNHQPDQTIVSVSKEKAEEITAGIKVSISKEDMDFFCSEEGFQKMKQDVADLYIENADQQKVIAKDKNPDDLFWNNTGNQWLVFSEMLYNNPIQSFNKVIAGMHSNKNSYSRFLDEIAPKPVSEYKYTVMLGMTEKSGQEKILASAV